MKNKQPRVSIIIPCRKLDSYTRECVRHCLNLDYKNYDIILLPDKLPRKKELKSVKSERLRIIATGSVMPALKRNTGMKESKADIYAFIDSDAYPKRDWLKNAIKYVARKDIGLVGGPNLTPESDDYKQKISGMLLATYFCGGRTSIRYKISKKQETIELPSCNFIVKKEFATEFEPDLLTAEDTKFCFNIWKKNKKVLYVPDVIVYHHRKPVFKAHLRQIWIYARDVALLLKRKKEFSLDKLYYSILSAFVLGVLLGPITFFSSFLRMIYFSVLLLYFFLVLISSLRNDLKAIPLLFIGIIATHFTYGLGFLYGLLSKSKKRLNMR
jgi:cellulose synthase/poly-beta-1,6-N-acetylglucosamine synthase-like glycosyltransferase